MKTVSIGTILEQLPAQTRTKVEALLVLPNVLEHTDELRQLLDPHGDALAPLGLVPGYAAYAMAYFTSEARDAQARRLWVVTAEIVDLDRVLDSLMRN